MIILAFLMLLPSERFPESKLLSYDKLGHMAVFGFLYLLLAIAFTKQTQSGWFKNNYRNTALTISIVYSLLLEFIQRSIPGRSFDLYDLIANSVGVVIGLIIFSVFNKK